MMKKILVAVDYLADTPQVFEQALELAVTFNASLSIFHCVEPPNLPMPEVSAMAVYGGMVNTGLLELQEQKTKEMVDHTVNWLETLADQAMQREVMVEVNYVVGEPRGAICKAAKETGADILVVGRRGLQGISEMLLGSVSSYVLHHAPCSVFVVQHREP